MKEQLLFEEFIQNKYKHSLAQSRAIGYPRRYTVDIVLSDYVLSIVRKNTTVVENDDHVLASSVVRYVDALLYGDRRCDDEDKPFLALLAAAVGKSDFECYCLACRNRNFLALMDSLYLRKCVGYWYFIPLISYLLTYCVSSECNDIVTCLLSAQYNPEVVAACSNLFEDWTCTSVNMHMFLSKLSQLKSKDLINLYSMTTQYYFEEEFVDKLVSNGKNALSVYNYLCKQDSKLAKSSIIRAKEIIDYEINI